MSGSQQRVPQVAKTRSNGPGRQLWSLVNGPLNEVGFQAGLVGKAPREIERRAGEIEPGHHGAATHKTERVAPNVALQVEDAFSGHVAKFGRFDRVESVIPRTKAGEQVAASGVALVNGGALIPTAAVDVDRVVH
jgi:hypothetical protein